MAMPLRQAGRYVLSSYIYSDSWISGIAFGNNIFGHAYNSAYNYHRAFNGESPTFFEGNVNDD